MVWNRGGREREGERERERESERERGREGEGEREGESKFGFPEFPFTTEKKFGTAWAINFELGALTSRLSPAIYQGGLGWDHARPVQKGINWFSDNRTSRQALLRQRHQESRWTGINMGLKLGEGIETAVLLQLDL